jgi:hypothetical protein
LLGWRWRYEALIMVVSMCDFMVCYGKLITSQPTQTLCGYGNSADVTETLNSHSPVSGAAAALCVYAPREQLLRR